MLTSGRCRALQHGPTVRTVRERSSWRTDCQLAFRALWPSPVLEHLSKFGPDWMTGATNAARAMANMDRRVLALAIISAGCETDVVRVGMTTEDGNLRLGDKTAPRRFAHVWRPATGLATTRLGPCGRSDLVPVVASEYSPWAKPRWDLPSSYLSLPLPPRVRISFHTSEFKDDLATSMSVPFERGTCSWTRNCTPWTASPVGHVLIDRHWRKSLSRQRSLPSAADSTAVALTVAL